jgi:hypothetical protein
MADRKYALLKWKDGWQEVVPVESDAIDFSRYYVIERKEHFGRLVINRPEGEYPGLLVIERSPMEISEIAMVDGGDGRELKQAATYQEGARLEYHYDLQRKEGSLIEKLKDDIRQALSGRGVSAKEILSKPVPERRTEIEAIGKAVHVVGGKKQEDLVGFIELLLEEMA